MTQPVLEGNLVISVKKFNVLDVNPAILFLAICPQRNTCICARTHTQKHLENCLLKHSLSVTKPEVTLLSINRGMVKLGHIPDGTIWKIIWVYLYVTP